VGHAAGSLRTFESGDLVGAWEGKEEKETENGRAGERGVRSGPMKDAGGEAQFSDSEPLAPHDGGGSSTTRAARMD